MKKSILFVAACFMMITSFGQSSLRLRATRDDNYDVPSSSWYYSDSTLLQYDGAGHDTTDRQYYYTQNTWKLRLLRLNEFDGAGRMTGNAIGITDTVTGQISDYYLKYVIDYNANGDTSFILVQKWSTVTVNWLNFARIYHYHDGQHHDTAQVLQKFVSNNWENAAYYQKTYDAAGNNTYGISYAWDASTTTYIPNEQYTSTFNQQNQTTGTVTQRWITSIQAWTNKQWYLYTWNSSGDNTVRERQLWSTNPTGWYNDSMFYQTFNSTHKILTQVSQVYDDNVSTYVNHDQSIYTYDANDNNIQYRYDYWYQNSWDHSRQETYQYNTSNKITYQLVELYNNSISMFENHDRTYYYYYDVNTGIMQTTPYASASLYPNPVNGNEAHISLENKESAAVTISVYDMQGRMVSIEERPLSTGKNDLLLDVAALPIGMYTVSIADQSGSKSSSMKMIKN